MSALEVVGAVLLLTGTALGLVAALGLLVLPHVGVRLQAATKPQTLGLLLVLLGALPLLDDVTAGVTLLLAFLLQLATAPALAQVVGRRAYRTGALDRGRLVVDDLARATDAPDDSRGDETRRSS